MFFAKFNALFSGFSNLVNSSNRPKEGCILRLELFREAVHGAVSAGAPKVFLKYFYVNTATGEKSGDMYASAKLGE